MELMTTIIGWKTVRRLKASDQNYSPEWLTNAYPKHTPIDKSVLNSRLPEVGPRNYQLPRMLYHLISLKVSTKGSAKVC